MGLERDGEELDKYSISEAVHELYEDLTTKVGKELHAVIKGKYLPPKRSASPTKTKDGKKRPTTPSSSSPSSPSPSPSPTATQEWNMTPWRPKSPSKKKKKKKVAPLVRRPFGPVGSVFPPGNEGDILYVSTLLSPWGCPASVNWCDPENMSLSPIILAASLGKETMVTHLLQLRASVFARSANGNTALHEAAKGGHTPVVLVLIQAGSEVDAMNDYGNTPLSSSVHNGHKDVSLLLVMVGASIDIKNKQNKTPLDRSDDEELKVLLRLKRNKFVIASQKRIMLKTLEVQAAFEQEKKQRLLLKQAQKAMASANDQSSDDGEEEGEEGEEEEKDEHEEEGIPTYPPSPIFFLIIPHQLFLNYCSMFIFLLFLNYK
eukprot:Phypoly_transcript_06328.p1 GENE.Phypoly_transcript_06328~~Phypoly_transcript_06328.p1  ORF type:complete len:375 (-),score=99.10 Phypoly_transcript_06328:544-1668(-)